MARDGDRGDCRIHLRVALRRDRAPRSWRRCSSSARDSPTIVSAQTILPLGLDHLTFWIALLVRGVFDAVEAVVERFRLQQSFSGQVSPAVMKEMLGGAHAPG